MIKSLKKYISLQRIFFLFKYFTNQIYYNKYFYSIINDYECFERAITFETKEVDTINWINGFQSEEILFDIGANIGVYSLYASPKINSVFAFEPHYQNYTNLNININLNKFTNIKAYCMAFDKNPGIGSFNLYKTNPGSSTSQLNRNLDHNNKVFEVIEKQQILVESLSSFIKKSNVFPNHIKIDVDGIEFQILTGLGEHLKDLRLKSILVEITGDSKHYEELLKSNGFYLDMKTPTSKKEEVYNYIFKKNQMF
jgi:FkbM family methyltransferase